MPQAVTKTRKSIKSSETCVWLAYDRTGFIVLGNFSKSPTGLHGSPKRPHGNASASPQKSDVSTDASGTVVETLDYYPYGAIRIDNSTGTPESRKFIGMPYDSQTQLSLLGARYYNGAQGQFISEDPIFLALGSPSAEQMAQQSLADILSNPQQLNAYSYSEDNPITKKDPSGKLSTAGLLIGLLTNLSGLLAQLSVTLAASTVAGHTAIPGITSQPAPASSALFNRSLSFNPGALDITTANQGQYGNAINQIQNDPDFENYVNGKIKASQNGTLDVPSNDPKNGSFAFKEANSKDLYTAFHIVNAGLSGTQSPSGGWNINVNITDEYNFAPNDSSGGTAAIANGAYIEQEEGIVSDYPIDINFSLQNYKPQ